MKRKGRGRNTQIFSATESEDDETKLPHMGQSITSKGLPPAPVIRPPENRRETLENSDRIEPNMQQQQLLSFLCEIFSSVEIIKQQQKLPDLTDLRLPLSSLEDLLRTNFQIKALKRPGMTRLYIITCIAEKQCIWDCLEG